MTDWTVDREAQWWANKRAAAIFAPGNKAHPIYKARQCRSMISAFQRIDNFIDGIKRIVFFMSFVL